MNLTTEWLEENNAPPSLIKWFNEQDETDALKIAKTVAAQGVFYWANFLILHLMTYEQCLAYEFFAAKIALDFFEKRYSKEPAPRNAVEATKRVLKNNTKENREAASIAAKEAHKTAMRAGKVWIYNAISTMYFAFATSLAAKIASTEKANYVKEARTATLLDCALKHEPERKEIMKKVFNYGIKNIGV